MTTRTAISNTFGIDPSELSDYRYHATRLTPCVYHFGNSYICAKKSKPKFYGDYVSYNDLDWHPIEDQFFAEKAGTVIWEANSVN